MADRFEIRGPVGVVNGRRLPSFASFELGPAEAMDPAMLVAGSRFAPCFFDEATGRMIFAEMPPSLDLRRVAFAFVELHKYARRLIAVSEEELHALASNCLEPKRWVFLFNTSRCGSTLLHRVFNQVPQVSSVGELSFVADLRRCAHDGRQRERVVQLLRSTYRLAAHRYGGVVSFKQLAPCTEIADLHRMAFPTASCLFLYRNAMDWAASWQRIREANGDHDVDMRMWLEAMDAYVGCQDSETWLTAVRYEDLSHHPEATLRALFAQLDWPASAVESTLSVFAEDAQAGTDLARAHGRPNAYRLTDEQRRSVERQLQQHATVWPFDPLLQGTLPLSPA